MSLQPPRKIVIADYHPQWAEDSEYVDWFVTEFVKPFHRVLSDTGSLVIDIGGAYVQGAPRRSTYHFRLAVALGEYFEMCQEFVWYNPAKLPSPAEWVNIRRIRVKDSCKMVGDGLFAIFIGTTRCFIGDDIRVPSI